MLVALALDVMALALHFVALLTSLISIYRYKKTQKPLVSKPTSEKGVTRGWLPQTAGAGSGSPGVNGGGDAATYRPGVLCVLYFLVSVYCS